MSTSITVVCYKSKTLSNGEHPLMLRICQDRKTKYQSLGVSIAEKHWDFEKNSPKSKCPNRDILIKLILKVQMEYQQKLLEKRANNEEYTADSCLTNIPPCPRNPFGYKWQCERQELIAMPFLQPQSRVASRNTRLL